ncbi:WD40 repeat domain-containing serine/threonine protein kinase [Lignipirellula cremea]|uniref:non-specific serine/threonine protein kinase n=1 Tax=Lignipirellula cremea TaxID=2528010 RepID=A0A518E0Q3_9BACT|nr:serine/threonine-protein kinase [Lignipirellula cremea]QDU97663.1 Serine/threonine-protein kinase PrkC [Lignipirellula cremea]
MVDWLHPFGGIGQVFVVGMAVDLSASVRQQLDQAAATFTRAWRAGQQPQLLDYLARYSSLDRSALVQTLLQAEIDLRREAGQTPRTQEYVELLPEHAETVRMLFGLADTAAMPEPSLADTLPEAKAAPEQTTTRLGDYELLERIGRGGMGVVYRARQTSLGRMVALKTIRTGAVADDDEEVLRFRAEAEAAAALNHPGIVPVYQFGQADGQWFLSMELVQGGTLNDLLRDGPLEPQRAAALLETIAAAVAAAHAQGVVHRDLKPGNVLLGENGSPRVTDFGLAKRTAADSGMTATGQILGTPSYMPPEQARGDMKAVGPASDVYSLGAMLYCLVTGRPPFQAANMLETLQQVQEREPVSPRDLNPSVPRDLQTICLKCLEKDPAKRYGSAQAMAEELQRFQSGAPILARPISRAARMWRWCLWHPLVASLLASITLLLVVTIVVAGQAYWLTRQAWQAEVAAREETDALLYESLLDVASSALAAGDLGRANEALARAPVDLRGWEWSFLRRRCQPPGQFLLDHENQEVFTGAFDDTGRWLATVAYPWPPNTGAFNDGQLRLWDTSTGELRSQVGRIQFNASLVVSPDGRWVVVDDRDGDELIPTAVRVFSVPDLELVKELPARICHRPWESTLAFDSQGSRLFVVDPNASSTDFVKGFIARPARVQIFDTATWEKQGEIVFGEEDRFIVDRGVICRHRAAPCRLEFLTTTGQVDHVVELPLPADQRAYAFDAEQRWALSSENVGTQTWSVWDLREKRKVGVVEEGRFAGFAPGGQAAFAIGSGSDETRLELRDLATLKKTDWLPSQLTQAGWQNSLLFSADGRRAVLDRTTVRLSSATAHGGYLQVSAEVFFNTGSLIGNLQAFDFGRQPDGSSKVVGSWCSMRPPIKVSDDQTALWVATPGRQEVEIAKYDLDSGVKNPQEVKALPESAPSDLDMRLMAFCQENRDLPGGEDTLLLDTATGARIRIAAHSFATEYDASRQCLATLVDDAKVWEQGQPGHAVEVYDMKSGRRRFSLPIPYAVDLAFAQDSRSLVVLLAGRIEEDSRFLILDALTGEVRREIDAAFTSNFLIHPGGERAILWSGFDEAGVVSVLEIESGKISSQFTIDARGAVTSLALHPGGDRIVAASIGSKKLQVYDLNSQRKVFTFETPMPGLHGGHLFFSPSGQRLLRCSSSPGTIEIWDSEPIKP